MNCPICHAEPGHPCLGIDYLPLPTQHDERTAGTPLFDELLAEVAS